MARLDASLQTLQNATYLGGSTNEWPNVMLIGSADCIYLAGYTYSADFPATVDAWQPDFPGGEPGSYHGFLTRMNAGLSVVHNSTFWAAARIQPDQTILQDGSGDIWAAGYAAASNFPTTPGAYSRTLQIRRARLTPSRIALSRAWALTWPDCINPLCWAAAARITRMPCN